MTYDELVNEIKNVKLAMIRGELDDTNASIAVMELQQAMIKLLLNERKNHAA